MEQRSNCLFYAVRRIWRLLADWRCLPDRAERSVGLGVRWSRFWWGWHFFVINDPPDEICEGFVPVGKKRRRKWWEIPIVFRGRVVRGKH